MQCTVKFKGKNTTFLFHTYMHHFLYHSSYTPLAHNFFPSSGVHTNITALALLCAAARLRSMSFLRCEIHTPSEVNAPRQHLIKCRSISAAFHLFIVKIVQRVHTTLQREYKKKCGKQMREEEKHRKPNTKLPQHTT